MGSSIKMAWSGNKKDRLSASNKGFQADCSDYRQTRAARPSLNLLPFIAAIRHTLTSKCGVAAIHRKWNSSNATQNKTANEIENFSNHEGNQRNPDIRITKKHLGEKIIRDNALGYRDSIMGRTFPFEISSSHHKHLYE